MTIVLYVNAKGDVTRFIIQSRASVGPVLSRFEDGSLIFTMGLSAEEIASMAPISYQQPQIECERGRHDA